MVTVKATEDGNLTSIRLSKLGLLQICCYRAIRKVKTTSHASSGSMPRPPEPISEKLLKGHSIKNNVRYVAGGPRLTSKYVADNPDTVYQSETLSLMIVGHMISHLFQATQDARRPSSSSIVPRVSSRRPLAADQNSNQQQRPYNPLAAFQGPRLPRQTTHLNFSAQKEMLGHEREGRRKAELEVTRLRQ